ncbi:MAG: hypothetical protein ACJ71I_08355 [Nitrososphaeraceae archaeon]
MEPNEIKFTPDYKANEPIFWGVFKELSKNNNGLVAYDKSRSTVINRKILCWRSSPDD